MIIVVYLFESKLLQVFNMFYREIDKQSRKNTLFISLNRIACSSHLSYSSSHKSIEYEIGSCEIRLENQTGFFQAFCQRSTLVFVCFTASFWQCVYDWKNTSVAHVSFSFVWRTLIQSQRATDVTQRKKLLKRCDEKTSELICLFKASLTFWRWQYTHIRWK